MGERKRLTADRRKEEQKNIAFAKLINVPTSPARCVWSPTSCVAKKCSALLAS